MSEERKCAGCGGDLGHEGNERCSVCRWLDSPTQSQEFRYGPITQPEPNADDVALRELREWMERGVREFRVGRTRGGIRMAVFSLGEEIGTDDVEAPTLAEAWACLKAQSGWPG